MPEKHYRRKELEEMYGVSGRQIYRMMDEGKFPRPVKLSANIVAWPESRIKEHQESLETTAS